MHHVRDVIHAAEQERELLNHRYVMPLCVNLTEENISLLSVMMQRERKRVRPLPAAPNFNAQGTEHVSPTVKTAPIHKEFERG